MLRRCWSRKLTIMTRRTSQVNIAEAKAHFSELVDRALSGEEVIIARDGKPLLRLAPLHAPKGKRRRPGTARGRLKVASDFDSTPEDFDEYVR